MTASLPLPAWPLCASGDAACGEQRRALQADGSPEFDTPAEQLPTVGDACRMGWAQLKERTEAWLDLAMDYELQTSAGNSGVVATQLCAEKAFQDLPCLAQLSIAWISGLPIVAYLHSLA